MKVNPQKQYSLDDSLQYIKGVGPKRALLLEKLGLMCIEDCLFFLPFRYEDRTLVKKIADLTPGERVTFTGEIVAAETQRIGRRRKFLEMHIPRYGGRILELRKSGYTITNELCRKHQHYSRQTVYRLQ